MFSEGTLAHCDVYCFDELPEFRRYVLEVLLRPLKESNI
jgi:predicted ATPase with chaperone activity